MRRFSSAPDVAVPPFGPDFQPFDPRLLMAHVAERNVSGDEHFQFSIISDTHLKRNFPRILAFVEGMSPDFILHLGDFMNNGGERNTDKWEKLAMAGSDLFRRLPVWPIIGNHDLGGGQKSGEARFLRFFGLDQLFYSFTVGRYKFIALSWELGRWGVRERDPETQWLKRELAAPPNKDIIVLCHRPVFPIARGRNRDDLAEIFSTANVRLVLSGHDHCYYRTRRGGTTYVTAGLGGSGVARLHNKPNVLPDDVYAGRIPDQKAAVYRNPPLGKQEQQIDLSVGVLGVRVDRERITGRYITPGGSELDHFELPME